MENRAITRLGNKGGKRNLFAHVVEELGTRIVRGDIALTDPFPSEADLGREFGASRSVIREAVKSLAARGLIESRTRTGIRVLPPNQWNLLDAEVLSWRYRVMPAAQFYSELFEVRLMIGARSQRTPNPMSALDSRACSCGWRSGNSLRRAAMTGRISESPR